MLVSKVLKPVKAGFVCIAAIYNRLMQDINTLTRIDGVGVKKFSPAIIARQK